MKPKIMKILAVQAKPSVKSGKLIGLINSSDIINLLDKRTFHEAMTYAN